MAATEACPNCGGEDVWLEDRATRIEFGCNLCNHRWHRAKQR